MSSTKVVTCCECGKKYKRIARMRYQQNDLGQWEDAPICKECWDGVVLVDNGIGVDDLDCDQCGDCDCDRSLAAREQWQKFMRDRIHKDYPSAKVVFLHPWTSEWQEEKSGRSGYLVCPMGYYEWPPPVGLPPCSAED
jgi:hypothetical protein